MKHQYFGDVNDYRKYGLLHGLSAGGAIHIGVCWMLTEPDRRSDGGMLAYLDKAEEFRAFAPDLFDFLRHCIHVRKKRRTSHIEAADFLPATSYFSELLSDDMRCRKAYFAKMLRRFAEVDLIFFDPDNGFEVSSKPIGSKQSSKYLSWCELQEAFDAGHSVLVYQHFPRENRVSFTQRIASTIMQRTKTDVAFSFRTPRVGFFLVPQPGHLQHLSVQAEMISKVWGDRQIAVQKHVR